MAAAAALAYAAVRIASAVAIVPDDAYLQYLPGNVLAARMVRAGHLPSWDPYAMSGIPLLGYGFMGALYPPNAVFLILPAVLASNISLLLSFTLAGVGAGLLAHRLTGDRGAAVLGGAAFALCNYLMGQVSAPPILAVCGWLPWAIFGVDLCVERVTPWRVVLASAAVGMAVLTGHGQLALMLVLAVMTYSAGLAVTARGRRALRPIAVAAGVVIAGLGLGAVQLVPTISILPAVSSRLSYAQARVGSFPLDHLPLLVFPRLFGGEAQVFPFHVLFQGRYGLDGSGGVSMAALALAAAGLGAMQRDRRAVALAVLGIVGLLLASAGSTPVGRLFYEMPVYGNFRDWTRYVVFVDLAVAMFAAYGVALLRTATDEQRRAALKRAVAVPVGVVLVALLTQWVPSIARYGAGGRDEALAIGEGILAAVAGVAACVAVARRVRAAVAIAVIVVVADLALGYGAFASWRNGVGRASNLRTVLNPGVPEWGPLPKDGGGITRFAFAEKRFIGSVTRSFPEASDTQGLRSINAYVPYGLVPRDYATVVGGMQFGGFMEHPEVMWQPGSHLLDLLRVTTVLLTPGPNPSPPPGSLLADGRPVPRTTLVRYDYAPRLPDAFLVGSVAVERRSRVVAAVRGEIPFEPDQLALVEEPCPGCPSGPTSRPGRAGTITDERWGDNSVVFGVRNERPAMLIVSQAWYPGWAATVDGRRTRVVRADAVVQGVAVPAGTHRVVLRYHPPGLPLGAAISAATAVLLAAWVFVNRRRRRA